MNWKRWTGVILALGAMLCLCGCHKEGQSAGLTGVNTPESTNPLPDGIPTVESPGNSLVEYDPEREIYIFCNNFNEDWYLQENETTITFLIFSKKQLDIEQIQVDISCNNNYEIDSIYEAADNLRNTQYNDNEDLNLINSGQSCLPYYVYQSYCGTNFELLAQLWELYLNPPEEGSEEAKAAEELTGGEDPYVMYQELQNAYLESYMALEPEDIREFYVYNVVVSFDGDVEETIEMIDFTIDGQVFHQNIGKLHLIPAKMPSTYPVPMDGEYYYIGSLPWLSWAVNIYGNGMSEFRAFNFTASVDMTITNFYFWDDVTKIGDIELEITSNGNTMKYNWDGSSPVYLYAGDEVSVYAVIQNPNLIGLYYDTNLYYELDMTADGEYFCLNNRIQMTALLSTNFHEIYAIVFDGLDMEPYYRDYYYPVYESWRENYDW